VVATITIPADFTDQVRQGQTVALPVTVDNANLDLTNDIQRALPSAIEAFGQQLQLPEIRVSYRETDLINHDTGYIPYLVVSALALDAFLLGAFLGAVAMAREWEAATVKLWRLSPASHTALLAGKLVAAGGVAFLAVLVTAGVVVVGYGVRPAQPVTVVAALGLCATISAAFGGWLGAVLRRTTVVVPLVFGLALPLYLDGGTLEPERFDGNAVWALAHLSPVYYAVGILESAFHRLRVTPEPVWADAAVLLAFALLAATVARRSSRRAVLR
jgi:ABC-2 type transport system permease protein